MMRTANPVLNDKTFSRFEGAIEVDNQMTLQGTINKTALLLLFIIAGAIWTWNQFFTGSTQVYPWMIGGLIGGFVLALIISFKPTMATYLTIPYALCEGLFLGGLSAVFEMRFPGIVIQAVALTFGTLFALLAAYKSGLIKATENFKLGIVAATGAIALFYFVAMILRLFGFPIGFIHSSGTIGIVFSLVVVAIAALNLVLDFDFIEQGTHNGAPKHMEWYGAFGLLVTLVWLYMEILRLLSKIRDRR